MSNSTPGRWTWWTSNSWRRLKADQGHGRTADVLMPTVHRDRQVDIIVSPADMALIEAAPDMHAVLEDLEDSFDRQTYDERMKEELDAPEDREYSVTITAKQWRAIGAALTKARAKP